MDGVFKEEFIEKLEFFIEKTYNRSRIGRQVDVYLKGEKSDADGYLTWDVEHWSSIDKQRFIRCYSYKGRVLSESTGHNIYDLQNDFKPEEAEKIELS